MTTPIEVVPRPTQLSRGQGDAALKMLQDTVANGQAIEMALPRADHMRAYARFAIFASRRGYRLRSQWVDDTRRRYWLELRENATC